jgi:serine/threonine-protein kinase
MNSEKWTVIKHIFNQALELPVVDRIVYVHEHGKDDPEILDEVLAMLAQEEEPAGENVDLSKIVASNAQGILSQDLVAERAILKVGELLDQFKVLSSIGEGGMGSVFLAQREQGDFEQFVAIKVIHKQHVNEHSIQRFKRERQILASLNHRNIASFIGGGETNNNLPYIILEYVKGTSIIEYCRTHKLDIAKRLQLFNQVLSAVSYAHQNLIVHRDIKPSNVLVTDNGDVKLLDFGIAKLLQNEDVGSTNDLTREEARLLTPGNASPEQITGGIITTRSDVYGLGTLFINMLCDEAIFDTVGITQREIEALILEKTPIKPSQKCQRSTDPVIQNRGKQLQGDLDTIALTAVQKDPARRYATVEQFSDDIRRYQQHYPIAAKPDSVIYNVSKFIKRNTLGVALSTSLMLVLIVFSLALVMQAKQTQLQRDIAVTEAAVSQQVADFMTDIFDASDPNVSAGEEPTASQLLDAAIEKLNTLEAPAIKAKLLISLGKVHRVLGAYEQAKLLLDEANELLPLAIEYPDDVHFIDRLNLDIELAKLAYATGKYKDAIRIFTYLINLLEGTEPIEQVFVEVTKALYLSDIVHGLANTLSAEGDDHRALIYYQQALELGLSAGRKGQELSFFYNGLGHALRHTGQYTQAVTALTQGIELARGPNQVETLDVAHSLNQLASTYLGLNEYTLALDVAKQGLAIRQRMFKTDHPAIVASMGMVANIYAKLGRLDEAIDLREQSQAMLIGLVGTEHHYYGGVTNSLASLQLQNGDLVKALSNFERSLASHQAAFPDGHYQYARPYLGLGEIALHNNDLPTALGYFRQAFEITEKLISTDHLLKARAAGYYSIALRADSQTEQADKLKQQALTMVDNLFGQDSDQYRQLFEIVNRPRDI